MHTALYERLGRIEGMLQQLIDALGEDEEPALQTTLDGEVIGAERPDGQSLG